MHTEQIILVGAGGHGKVVLDALLQSGTKPEHIVVVESNTELAGRDFLGLTIKTLTKQSVATDGYFHVAIGNDAERRRLWEELRALGGMPFTVLHPAAVISRFSTVGSGAFVAAHAIVGPAAQIGQGVIINHGAVVDHDCVIGPFSHVAPNATLGGGARVGSGVLIGAGATVLPGKSIGSYAVIGAGAVVLSDVGAGKTCIGVPATVMAERST